MLTRRGFFPVVLGLLGFAATAEAKPRRPKPRPKRSEVFTMSPDGTVVEEWRELHGDKEMLWQAIQQQLGSFHPKFPWMVATRIEDIKHVGQTKHTFRVIYKVSEVPL